VGRCRVGDSNALGGHPFRRRCEGFAEWCLPCHRFSVGWPLIIPMIIQTILLYPSGAVWTDAASHVSRLDPSGAYWVDAEHPTRNRKVEVRGRPGGWPHRRLETRSHIGRCRRRS
jgi:hypothetical protein